MEYYFKRLKGVTKTTVGFMGGSLENPSYKEVKTGATGHLETIKVDYDPTLLPYDVLVKYFFEIHDFEQTDGQGIDIGSQYLSAIWVADEQEQAIAENIISGLSKRGYKVATIIKKVATFYQAEDYHQDYLDLRHETPECHVYRKVF